MLEIFYVYRLSFFHLYNVINRVCVLCVLPFPLVFAEAIHGNVHQHRDEFRNQHFFAPEYGSKYLMPLPYYHLSQSGKISGIFFYLNLGIKRKVYDFFQQRNVVLIII